MAIGKIQTEILTYHLSDNTIAEIGERGLLAKIQPYCASGVVGDDGAVLEIAPGHKLVVTTDVLVDLVHFSDRTTTPFDVGWRAAAANLSDLAAMGANPVGITVGLSLPKTTLITWVEELYRGLQACLQQFDTPIIGGDLTRSEVITVAITALGQVLPHQIISRSTARPGDAILITGYHGLSKAGLELLLDPDLGQNLDATEINFLTKIHQRPQPRLDVIAKLRQIDPNARVTGMDSSDGLFDAIAQICHCSGVGAIIDSQSMKRCPILDKLPPNCAIEQWIFDGGEDFESILCLPFPLARELRSYLGEGAAIIGSIEEESKIIIKEKNRVIEREVLDSTVGFQHFAN